MYFAVGPDAERPDALVEVARVVSSSPASGGVAELGSDVAFGRLIERVPNVPPLVINAEDLNDTHIGSELMVLGYGVDSSGCSQWVPFHPVRRLGEQVLNATAGNVFDHIYGSYSEYMRDVLFDRSHASAVRRYNRGVLLEGYEAWMIRAPTRVRHVAETRVGR
jgi:hypothetical protein